MTQDKKSDFEKIAQDTKANSLFGEMWEFLVTNKKWWLTPIVLMLLLIGAILLLSTTAAAPFIYTLF